MATVDFHQHLWPDEFVSALRSRTSPPFLDGDILFLDGEPAWPIDLQDHALDARLARMDRDGIDVAVISLQPGLGFERLPARERDDLIDAWAVGMRGLTTAVGRRLRVLAPTAALDGYVGACVAAPALGDLDRLASLLDDLCRRGLPLFVHPGAAAPPARAPAWWGAVVDYTAQMHAAYAAWLAHGVPRWPTLNVVFAILAGGAPFHLERLQTRGISERAAIHRTIYFDTASYGRRALDLTLATVGVANVVYGSDTPVIDPSPTLHAVRGFGDALAEHLLVTNPNRVLP